MDVILRCLISNCTSSVTLIYDTLFKNDIYKVVTASKDL
jgi:hypothetical protein